jgi:hypothetical protein
MRGRTLRHHMLAEDYAHVVIACLTHDIGYVRGLLPDDDEDGYLVDASGRCRRRSAISTSPPQADSGSPISTATSSAPSATSRCPGRRNRRLFFAGTTVSKRQRA